ncbi:ribokinase [Hujiaoplasma nucleasis]|uniref:Ribokinase n=1 Tax=Hujiaoplasma nucleasis TaxID=2725268 RepID=A0A7L6N2X7_9MOLU|nr:ribokinase [Hujiaoplasma nucleasis]QLY40620.1 ribokinase [Hujiaoplasma nucleasis]
MKNKYVSVIGSLNYDFFLKVNRLPKPGENMHAKDLKFSCGGKGANQAYQMGKLGLNVYMIGCVGDDEYGDKCIQSLNDAKVNTSFIRRVHCNTGLGFVSVQEDGEVSAILDEGANAFVSIDMIKALYDHIFNSEYVVLQMEIPMETIKYIIKEAEKHDVKIVLNPAPAQELEEKYLNKVHYLIVNEVEAGFYLGENYSDEELLEHGFDLRKKVKSGLILTLGSKGSYYIDEYRTFIPIVKAKAVDSTGAGDSYIGSFVYGLFNGYTPVESCQLGARSSAQTVEAFGRESMPSMLK